jgi:eukaryotic-like serine/threonine-protein kinase
MIAVGTTLAGRYRVERALGHGGMASVFVAHDELLQRAVAIKALRQGESVDRRRFDREARILAGLTHPNLVAVYDAGEEDGELYMVLELIDGPTLADRLAAGRLADDEVRLVGRELAAALAQVHAQGIVHRDVKPSNVLFDRAGQARLGDFGVARVADTTALTATTTTIGTAAYMAPEQVEGLTATPRADVYALGLVLLESLTGRRAYPGPAPAAALARLSRDPEVPAELPPPWPTLLAAMTTRDPSGRPDSTAVVDALDDEPAVTAVTTAVSPATMPLPIPPPDPTAGSERGRARRRAALWLGAALLALLIAAVAFAAIDDPTSDATNDTSTEPQAASTAPTTVPTTTAAAVPPPGVDCAALAAEKDALEERRREIGEQYRDDHETRDRLRDQIDARRHEIDEQLREHCR